ESGFFVTETIGDVPEWITIGEKEFKAERADVTAARGQLETARADLRSFDATIGQDPQLRRILDTISATWDIRIRDMEEANRRREQSMETLGIRLGARWAGGTRGVFGGIVSAEERAGIQRVADIEAKKQASLLNAEIAFREEEWDRYGEMVDLAEEEYKEQVEELEALNEATLEQNKMIFEETQKAVALDLLRSGVTDPLEIQRASGMELDEIGDLIDVLDFEGRIEGIIAATELEYTALETGHAEFIKSRAEGMGVPAEMLQSAIVERALSRKWRT
ncbi:unnamed protein product, partial [marine sediment metagenome]